MTQEVETFECYSCKDYDDEFVYPLNLQAFKDVQGWQCRFCKEGSDECAAMGDIVLEPEGVDVPLENIVIDNNIYPRAYVSDNHIEAMEDAVRTGQVLPPILLDRRTMRLIDGFHRYQRAKRAGDKEIRAILQWFETEQDVFEAAISANAAHGFNYATTESNGLSLQSSPGLPNTAGEKQMFYINQLTVIIEQKLLDPKQDRLTYALHKLASLIQEKVPLYAPKEKWSA